MARSDMCKMPSWFTRLNLISYLELTRISLHRISISALFSNLWCLTNKLIVHTVTDDTLFRFIFVVDADGDWEPVLKSAYLSTWWRHQMEIFSALLALCEGSPPVVSLTKASDAELWCFLWCVPELTAEQTVEMLVIWDAMALIVTSL